MDHSLGEGWLTLWPQPYKRSLVPDSLSPPMTTRAIHLGTMSTTYVAIGLEKTGLDPNSEEIIEMAAVTFRDQQILDEWSSLVNPYRQVPPFTTKLTGICFALTTLNEQLTAVENVVLFARLFGVPDFAPLALLGPAGFSGRRDFRPTDLISSPRWPKRHG